MKTHTHTHQYAQIRPTNQNEQRNIHSGGAQWSAILRCAKKTKKKHSVKQAKTNKTSTHTERNSNEDHMEGGTHAVREWMERIDRKNREVAGQK